MKRKAIFLGGPIAILLLLAAGFGLLRFYLAEAAELLVAKYTDAGASIERIDIGFLPPCITVHGLSLDTGRGQGLRTPDHPVPGPLPGHAG